MKAPAETHPLQPSVKGDSRGDTPTPTISRLEWDTPPSILTSVKAPAETHTLQHYHQWRLQQRHTPFNTTTISEGSSRDTPTPTISEGWLQRRHTHSNTTTISRLEWDTPPSILTSVKAPAETHTLQHYHQWRLQQRHTPFNTTTISEGSSRDTPTPTISEGWLQRRHTHSNTTTISRLEWDTPPSILTSVKAPAETHTLQHYHQWRLQQRHTPFNTTTISEGSSRDTPTPTISEGWLQRRHTHSNTTTISRLEWDTPPSILPSVKAPAETHTLQHYHQWRLQQRHHPSILLP